MHIKETTGTKETPIYRHLYWRAMLRISLSGYFSILMSNDQAPIGSDDASCCLTTLYNFIKLLTCNNFTLQCAVWT